VIVLPHLFSSGVQNQRGTAKRTMAQRPWNNDMMKGTVSTLLRHRLLLLKVAFVFCFDEIYICLLFKLQTMKDSFSRIVLYYDFSVNRYILFIYFGMEGSQG